jgi:replicative DNA helicase
LSNQEIPFPGMEQTNQPPLPESFKAEQAVLGAVLLDPKEALDEAMEKLSGPEFHDPAHRKIFKAMSELWEEGVPVDIITLVTRIQEKGWLEEISGVSYLSNLASGVPTAANIGYWIGILIQKYSHRQLIGDLQEQLHNAWQSSNPSEVIAATQSKLETIAELSEEKKGARTIREILPEVFEEVGNRYMNQSNGSVTGVTSGFTDLDRMTAGFQKSDFIIIAARPSVGKTAFALNIGRNAAKATGETIAVFSLEMSEKQLVGRLVCAEGNVDASSFRTGHLNGDDWEKMTMSIGSLSELPILIDDTPAMTISEIRSKCRRIKKERGLGMILIDYLQLITGRGKAGENRQEEVSLISRTLKQIARELDVPVIALSQLSRGVEQRQDKRPMMSDLRDSGSLEQDADIVAFLYRDDYYNKESEKEGIIEIIIAKQRNGPVGTVELAFLKNFNKFVSLDRTHKTYDQPKRPTNDKKKDYRYRE